MRGTGREGVQGPEEMIRSLHGRERRLVALGARKASQVGGAGTAVHPESRHA